MGVLCADAMCVQVLDLGTGDYHTVYSVPASYTSPNFADLNAAGLNPVDTKNYAALWYSTAGSPTTWLVRFDANAIEVLGKLRGHTVAGTFGADGSYYYVHSKKLYKIQGVPMLSML